jgi:hypothetical protein
LSRGDIYVAVRCGALRRAAARGLVVDDDMCEDAPAILSGSFLYLKVFYLKVYHVSGGIMGPRIEQAVASTAPNPKVFAVQK